MLHLKVVGCNAVSAMFRARLVELQSENRVCCSSENGKETLKLRKWYKERIVKSDDVNVGSRGLRIQKIIFRL